MAWAREEFRLSKRDKGGTSLRDHMKAAGIDEPNGKPFPEALGYLWEWFTELAARRSVGMGPNPITWEAMAAWIALTGTKPEPWEARAIFALDNAFIEARGA